MTKEEQNKQAEQILDFDKATDMTVGEAMRKSAEIEAGVTEADSALEKYIKQHREEIEAGKFQASSKEAPASPLADFIQDQREENVTEIPAELVVAESEKLVGQVQKTVPEIDTIPMSNSAAAQKLEKETAAAVAAYELEEEKGRRKRFFLYGGLVAALLLLIGGGTIAYNLSNSQNNSSGKVTASSSSSSKSSTSSSSSENTVKTFTDLYNNFFTDDQHTTLKNSSFGNLDQLKAALDKLTGDKDYETYKKQYEDLLKQVTAVQAVNGQFQTAAITDGVLDTKAQAKTDANFTDTSTGNANLDSLLKSAIEQGRSQVIATPAPQTGAGNADYTAAQPGSTTTIGGTITSPIVSNPVVNGVTLQRNLSRVPYNQAAIDDASNPAWEFGPGILENILKISRERGYFTGDNYILEKVNIINGRGYYNLFRSDGTYLFSINCKTGYFVGNGKGYAENLDF